MRVVLFLIASSNTRPASSRASEWVSLDPEVVATAAVRDCSGIFVISLALHLL